MVEIKPEFQIAKMLASKMAEKASMQELKRIYEETMYQQFISMDKDELQQLLWHG